ncbi:MAG: ACT domain-containing protein, partial [Gammaproteobacteria bacterium]|nr:ACT domain-containing protein [Gammaproteobacteria bacterium]
LHTSRARSRVRAWFKRQDYGYNLGAGRSILDRELHRVGLSAIAAEKIAERFRGRPVDEFLVALGSGEITTGQLARSLGELVPKEEPLKPRQERQRRKKKAGAAGGFDIQGVGNLMTTTARCCRPVPNDPIIGYITRGRGVTIHRQDCGNILRLRDEDRDRLITVDWGQPDEAGYLVDILVEAYDRAGLLRDITSLLASEKINLTGANTRSDAQEGIAYMNLTLEIADISQLSRVLTRIGQLQNVISARRKV